MRALINGLSKCSGVGCYNRTFFLTILLAAMGNLIKIFLSWELQICYDRAAAYGNITLGFIICKLQLPHSIQLLPFYVYKWYAHFNVLESRYTKFCRILPSTMQILNHVKFSGITMDLLVWSVQQAACCSAGPVCCLTCVSSCPSKHNVYSRLSFAL